MKTLPSIRNLVIVALIVTMGLFVLSCSTTPTGKSDPIHDGKPSVVFEKGGGVLVPRALKLRDDDLASLNATLKKYKKSLYQVRYYNDGKPTRSAGAAKCVSPSEIGIIDEAALKSGASNVAIQASVRVQGSGLAVEKKPLGGGGPTCTSASTNVVKAQGLSEQVTAILKKYSHP